MRVLLGCEESGIVRDEFAKLGHDAWSCDIIPSRKPGKHYQCDIQEVLGDGWDMGIFFPPCTYMANSGNKHLYIDGKKSNGRYEPRWNKMEDAANFFKMLWMSDIPLIGMENPIMHPYAKQIIGSEQTQTIQPYMFGHLERKATCLWLRGLPKLQETKNVLQEMLLLPKNKQNKVHYMAPSPTRARDRSVTYLGIAQAMAEQWGTISALNSPS